MRNLPTRRRTAESVAVLDIGTSKIACFVAHEDQQKHIHVTGIGHQLSKGVRAGIITDFADAETSILAAVHDAERMAGTTIDRVAVVLSGGSLLSRNVTIEMHVGGEEINDQDLIDMIEQGRHTVASDEVDVLHTIPVNFSLDTTRGIQDPRQMCGENLQTDLHIITAGSPITRNLEHCIARCHMNVTEYVAAPYAAAYACLDHDEMELGVTLIDLGGGTTSFAIFHAGKNIYTETLPVGGMHVTSDIAKGLSTTLSHAERLKTLHGSCIPTANDDQVLISAPLLGEDESEASNTMSRSALVGIIRPRVEEIFEMVKSRIETSGVEQYAGRRVVLTGGASQLIGIRELASRTLGKHVRIGKPKHIPGLAESVAGPAFSAALGVLHYTYNRPFEEKLFDKAGSRAGFFPDVSSVVGWLKRNF